MKKLSELMESFRNENPTDETVAFWIEKVKALEAASMIDMYLDVEAIAWAYQKLCNFVVQNSTEENAMMMDRLNLMMVLHDPTPQPEVPDGYEAGVTFMDRNPKPLGNL